MKLVIVKFYASFLCFNLGPNIILNTVFTNTLGLCYSLNLRDHISHPCKIYRKLIYS